MREWEAKHGQKQSGLKQLRELEEKRKQSIVSFLTHGLEFGQAKVFSNGSKLDNPETQEEASQVENGAITAEVAHQIQDFLETKEYESTGEHERCLDEEY